MICEHKNKIYSAHDGMGAIKWKCASCDGEGLMSGLLELYKNAEERATSYMHLLEELTKRSEAIAAEGRYCPDMEFMDLVSVCNEVIDRARGKTIDAEKGSFSVRVEKECNPGCVLGKPHDECTGQSGVWLPKLLGDGEKPEEMVCTIVEGEYE